MSASTRTRKPSLAISAALVVGALVLAGCSSSPSPSPHVEPETQSEEVAEVKGEAAQEEVAAEEPAILSGDACLVGKWHFDNDSFRDAFEWYAEQEGGAVRVASISGSADADFRADGTATTTYDNWHLVMEGEGGQVSVHRDGTDGGTWSTSGDQLELVETEPGSVVTVEAGGMVLDGSGMGMEVSGGSFECNGDLLLLTGSEGATTKGTRVG